MFTPKERDFLFKTIINKIKSSNLIEGIVQLGSGVNGYNDVYSDIDLMISTANSADLEKTMKHVRDCLSELNSIYIKEKELYDNVYLIIAFMENRLELNISILQTAYLNVKSPLWKVVFDKTGKVSEKMFSEHEHFVNKKVKYSISEDVLFEFVFSMRRFQIELKRSNLIYALQVLEVMRDYTLQLQAHNENKKLHQFKAFDSLSADFISEYLNTYPNEITIEKLLISAKKLKELFIKTVQKSNVFSMDIELNKLLN